MKHWIAPAVIATLASVACFTQSVGSEDEVPKQPDPELMKEMMKKMEEARKTGPEHEKLKFFLGDWSVDWEIVGYKKGSGTATISWAIEGRWLGHRLKTSLPSEGFMLSGYDRYSKSYVTAAVSDMDTSLNVSRAPQVDRSGKMTVEYGVLREYTTGELDKPFKVVRKIVDDDTFTVDVWDLGIGESGQVVLAYTYKRVKK